MDRRTIRSKKSKTRNARPYDRPNQSILGRVASKVKGLLNPSWIFNVSQWMGTQEEDSNSDPQEEESGEDEEPQPRGAKRPRMSNLDQQQPSPPSILSEGTQTWMDTPSSSLFNPSSRLTSTVTQDRLMDNKAEQVIINGDDHSENSEGSASTSGCSSLVSSHKERLICMPVPNRRLQSPFENLRSELSRRDVTSRKDESADMSASRMSLWSGSSMFSPSAKLPRRSPAVGHSSQPGFNVSTFIGPSKMKQQADIKVASPFYQGKTSFGGASSSRRMPASVAPYQVDRPARNQIKVRSKESEDSLEGMSSAAKRILMTLEKMSSPVTDAKKIPNTNKSPVDLSLYLMPPKFRSHVVSTPTITKGPPIANISAISKLRTLKSCSNRLPNNMDCSLITPETRKTPISEAPQPAHPPTESLSPKGGGGKMRSRVTQPLRPSTKNLEKDNDLDYPNFPEVHLPISTLPSFSFEPKPSKPITESNPRLEFEFSPPIEVLPQSAAISDSKSDKQNSTGAASFKFSSPTELGPGGIFSVNSTTWECSNCWVRNPTKDTKCLACEKPKSSSSSALTNNITPMALASSGFGSTAKSAVTWKCSECWIQNPEKETKCLSCETPKKLDTTHKPVATPQTVFGSVTKTSSKWSCSDCWTENPEKENKCLACEAPKKSSAPSGFNSSNKPATWQCSECWVQNPEKDVKCLSCETPRKGATASKTLPPLTASSGNKSNWKCSSCWVENSSNASKCIACEAANPSGGKTSGLPEIDSTTKNPEKSSFFKLPVVSLETEAKKSVDSPQNATPNGALKLSSGFLVSDWECDTCSVRNTSDKLQCSACETLRPSKRNYSGFKDPENFKFNSSMQSSPITFKIGSFSIPVQPTVTSSTCTFGDSSKGTSSFFSTASNLSASNTKASEEPTSTETSASKPVPGFKFGTPNMPTVEVTKPEIPVVDLADNDDSKEKPATVFGSAPSKTSESNLSFTSTVFKITPQLFGNTSDSGASSFFTPPSTTTSNTLKNAEEPKSTLTETTPSVPLFKFGATTKPAAEVKTEIPVVDLVDNDNEVKPTDVFGTALSKSSNAFKNTPFTLPVSTENKLPSLFSAKADTPAAYPLPTLNSMPSQASQNKENPPGGFNFKAPTLGSSAFGGFNAKTFKNPASVDEKPKPLEDKRSDSPFFLGVSSPSITSPFTPTTSSTSVFKMADKVDSTKTTESLFSKNIPAASTSATTAPVFTFGAAASTASSQPEVKPAVSVAPFSAAAPTTSTFSFGAVAATSAQATAPTGGFSFFAGSTAPAAAPSMFTFGATSNAAEPAKTTGFPATSSASVFGAAAPAPATSAFVFGAVKAEPVNSTPATNFAFGSGTTTPAAPSTFSGFQTNQPTSTPALFQFGSQPSNSTPAAPSFGAANSGFTFGAKSEAPNQLAPTATSQASGFGVQTMQQNMFGSAAPSAFGKTENKAGFNFGAAPTASTPFQFGNVEKKPAAPQFNFGTPQQDPNAGQFQPQFSMNTPPTFNFGAAATQAGPFQFAASSAVAETQMNLPPGQRRIRKAVRRRRD